MILTDNEKKILRFLATSQGKDYSINDISKFCQVTPNGAYKILKKLETGGILKVKAIANIKSYKLDFSSEKTVRVLELAFIPETIEGKIKSRLEDLEPLKEVTKTCIIFGSYITSKEKPNDIDIFFVLEKADFAKYKKILNKVKDRLPISLQDVVQTEQDLNNNLTSDDPVVIQALRTGIVLWGAGTLVSIIKNVHPR